MTAIYDWFSPLSRDFATKQHETFNIPAKQDRLGHRMLKTAEYEEWLLGSGKALWCIGNRKCCLSSCVSAQYFNRGSRSLFGMEVMPKELVGYFQSTVHETGDEIFNLCYLPFLAAFQADFDLSGRGKDCSCVRTMAA